MRASRGETTVEVVHQSDNAVSLLFEHALDGATAPSLAALPGVLAQHGLVAILDPIIAAEGRVRVRFIVPRPTEAHEALRVLQEIPRACGFADFRILRIGALTPAIHIEAARRSLPPEQETLLALAASMGYYETPKVVTLEEIARAVGLSISPVHKRLKAAEEAIVSQHVAPGPADATKRRGRPSAVRIEPTSPWEMHLRVRGEIGPSSFLAQTPGARAAIHLVSSDGPRGQQYILVVAAPQEAQEKLLASLSDRPDVSRADVLDRSAQHLVLRIASRERGAYSLGWWSEAWGQDAALRCIVLQDGEAYARAFLARPHTSERLAQRLADCAHLAGWTEWDLVALRPLATHAPPSPWPEPLTQRQLEVLRVAHALGYYRTPRECTLEHVASTLGVSANAIHKNLVLAESKLIASYLAGGL